MKINTNKKIGAWLDSYAENHMSPKDLLTKVTAEFNEKNLPYFFASIFTEDEIKAALQ